jgi:hypothetical protein
LRLVAWMVKPNFAVGLAKVTLYQLSCARRTSGSLTSLARATKQSTTTAPPYFPVGSKRSSIALAPV